MTDDGVWARFDGEPCAWELRDDGDDGLSLTSLAVDAPVVARGPAPATCDARVCVYEGMSTAAGPVVLVVEPSTASEMPSGVQLGVVTEDRLVFVDLWEGAGASVDRDFTAVGPAHALAPVVCDGQLGLQVVERLDGARGVQAPHSLHARAGLLDVHDPTVAAGGEVPAGCTPIPLPIP